MEEPKIQDNSGRDRSVAIAESLRAVREKADQTLDTHRRKLTDIESDLNLHLQQISEELARERVAEEMEVAASQQLKEEFDHSREMLSQLQENSESLGQELIEANSKLDERSDELEQLREQHQNLENEQTDLCNERDQIQESLNRTEADLESLRSQLSGDSESHLAQLAEQNAVCGELQQQVQEEQAEQDRLAAELEQIQATLDSAQRESESIQGQLDSLSSEHYEQMAQRDESIEQLQRQIKETQADREQLAEQREQLRQQNVETEDERNRLQGELEAACSSRDELQNQECSDCQNAREETEAAEQQVSKLQQELQSIQEELTSEQEERKQTEQSLETEVARNEAATQMLRDAEQKILAHSGNPEAGEQLEQFQRKFDLALADVQKLKQANIELQEELAHRPEADQQESPELEDLRSERDALAARVLEYENAPASESDAETEQAIADLQQRFEMAVEDVRELKQENSALQEQINRISSTAPVVVDDGPLDWQAQKALLLAELDAEDNGGIAPERHEARTTIEGTISITDRVVSEKDDEIARLQSLLESGPSEEQIALSKEAAHEELFNQDEMIKAERTRLEQVTQEMEEKLREAELEISVKRATLAREEAALQEKLAHLPEEKAEEEPEAETGKPRRRWLSALGLKDDGEES